MTLIAIYDLESNGLLTEKLERDGSTHPPLDRLHTETLILWDPDAKTHRYISAANQPGYEKGERHWNEETKGEDGKPKVIARPANTAPPGAIVWERMPIVDALRLTETADMRVGHNIQDFDERAIPMVYPWFRPKPGSTIRDTLIMSRCIYPDIHRTGPNGHKVYGFLKNAHSLKAWGLRLGNHKGDYKGGWMEWSEDMQRYGEQDTIVVFQLFKFLMAQKPAPEMLELEHQFAQVIRRQEARGVCFDHDKAQALLAELLTEKSNLEAALIETFSSWWAFGKAADSAATSIEDAEKEEYRRAAQARDEVDENDLDAMADLEDEAVQEQRRKRWVRAQGGTADTIVVTKTREVKMVGVPDITKEVYSEKTGKRLKDYVGPPKTLYALGAEYTPIKRVQFNPASRTQIIKRLKAQFGWEPTKFTAKDNPIVDDAVLRTLPWPEAQKLADYFLVNKRIGQLATGKKGWLKVAKPYPQPNGSTVWRIHGRVNTNGAGTGRCTHSDPNLAQVPKNSAEDKNAMDCVKGYRYRELFIPSPGYTLVGFDGAALELRMLAHFVAPYDGGEYARIVDEGNKKLGTDPHSWLRTDIIGEDLIGSGEEGRDHSKTVMYADLYGAGDEKVGAIIAPQASSDEKRRIGRMVRARMASRFTAKAKLQADIVKAVLAKGSLNGLDKRKLYVRKPHAALNTLLQSAGAVTMKKALVLLDADLQAHGLIPGQDYEFVLNIHDEAQADVLPQAVPLYERLASAAMVKAGPALRLKCPLLAEASHGDSWRETH